jgi:hypothetical protein
MSVLFVCISLSSFAQQESNFYIRINMKEDITGKYDMHFEKYIPNGISSIPYGKSIPVSVLQNATCTMEKTNLKNDEEVNSIYFEKERNYYDYSKSDSMFASIIKIVIVETNTKQKMYVVVPVTTNAKWVEIFLQDIKFEAGKYLDVLKYGGRFDGEDNTVRITVDKKIKNKISKISTFKL